MVQKGPRTSIKHRGCKRCSSFSRLNIGLSSDLVALTDLVQEAKLPSRKRHYLTSTSSRSIEEPIEDKDSQVSVKQNKLEELTIETNKQKLKNIVSCDGKSKIRSKVFFASLDQRSEKVAGEAACATVAVVVAHWLHANPLVNPSQLELDSLITKGSSLWQSLCKKESYLRLFPNKHFDIETIISTNLRPIRICLDNSFTGVFSPEKFKLLQGLMSLDEIWREIERNVASSCIGESRVYIMSWNDHFFVLKADLDEYYIIDSLSERLFAGCNQAYILKFDVKRVIYDRKVVKKNLNRKLEAQKCDLKEETMVCKGKECCREYIKRFLAVIPVAELVEEKEKGRVLIVSLLHKKLHFDLHHILMNN